MLEEYFLQIRVILNEAQVNGKLDGGTIISILGSESTDLQNVPLYGARQITCTLLLNQLSMAASQFAGAVFTSFLVCM